MVTQGGSTVSLSYYVTASASWVPDVLVQVTAMQLDHLILLIIRVIIIRVIRVIKIREPMILCSLRVVPVDEAQNRVRI